MKQSEYDYEKNVFPNFMKDRELKKGKYKGLIFSKTGGRHDYINKCIKKV